MAKVEKTPTAEFSSYYGCYIIAMAAFVFFGIIAWSAYSLLAQDREIGKITVDAPAQLSSSPLSPDQITLLKQRLAAFGEAAKSAKPASLDLTIHELNAIIQIAPDTGYGKYDQMVRVAKTDPVKNTLIASISLPVKRLKFWEGKMRYLVGEGTFLIETGAEGIDAKLVDVTVPGKAVPAGFVGNLQVWTWIKPYRSQEPLGTMLKGVKKAAVTAIGLSLSTEK